MSNPKFEKPIFLALVAGVGCFLLSFIGMGLAPWTSLKRVTDGANNDANPYYETDGKLSSIGRGKEIYIKEACWHCHSQFTRPVAGEPFRYGPPSQAWESRFDIPQMFGTRRVGPDLSRESGRRPDDWHYAHLYNPRSTTPQSIMPSYRWYFEEVNGTIQPKQEAKDLVAYLQWLGIHYQEEIQSLVYPKLFKVVGSPNPTPATMERGAVLFTENCSGCHGDKGNGLGKARDFLAPASPSLSRRYVSASEAYSILNRGVFGSAMPSFREMPAQDLWALAEYVSSLGMETKEEMKTYLKGVDATLLSQGKKTYQTYCIACHGEKGAGDGVAAAALNPRPKDFTRRAFEKSYLKEILKSGISGSAMMPFPMLTDLEVNTLHAYLGTFLNEEL